MSARVTTEEASVCLGLAENIVLRFYRGNGMQRTEYRRKVVMEAFKIAKEIKMCHIREHTKDASKNRE